MESVFFGFLAGVAFGGLNIAVMHGLRRASDVEAGSFVMMAVALAGTATAAGLLDRYGGEVEAGRLWPFLLIGAAVPGGARILVTRAVRDAGASRAGILFGVTPLVSALIAIAFFDEPFKTGLVIGTLLIVVGAIGLAWEPERPVEFKLVGLLLAVVVAVMFGIRDNVVRWTSAESETSPQVEVTVALIGATVAVGVYLVIQTRGGSPFVRARAAFIPFLPAGLLTGIGTLLLFEAFDRGRVTIVAPLAATAVLWTVVFAALFLGRSEAIGRRIVVVALLIVAGGAIIGVTR